MYELKIYRGVMCHDKEEWCKIWREIDLSVQIDMRNLKHYDPSTQKTQEITL